MKATLTFTDPRWDVHKTEQQLSGAITRARKELKETIREKHREGGSKANGQVSARRRGRGFLRGHRASSRGNAPAPDTLTLLNSIDDRRTGVLSGEVFVKDGRSPDGANPAVYAEILDNPSKLNRPFFHSTVTTFRDRFMAIIRAALEMRG